VTNPVAFEYDANKSAENKRKHGIDFEEAQELWTDADLVEIPARTIDEPRWLLIGKISQKHWSAVIARREDLPKNFEPDRRYCLRASATASDG
jgi:uncharacterized DUF497 family protein